MNHKKRKLRAILFADIVGYTALMQKDEAKASQLIGHFQQQLEETVKSYQGRIVNFYGDGALCTFEIPIEAVRCAMALQTVFRENPKTPVRIGIHSGTVTLEGEKIFGDSVNITSRIESMGVAGGILLSKKVRDEVKNNPDLQMQSLGSFAFKNVEEPMEIFALANEGFVVPKKEEMQGKGKAISKSLRKLWYVLMPILLLIGAYGIYQWQQSTSTAKITGAIRNERIAVLPFKNNTNDVELEILGDMSADWINRGLMEIEDVEVTSPFTVRSNLGALGIAPNDPQGRRSFSELTGAQNMLSGNYYEQNGDIIFQLQIESAIDGKIRFIFDPIRGPKDDKEALLTQLGSQVAGYWIAREMVDSKNIQAPKYEAYVAYHNALLKYDAGAEYAKVFELDSSFYLARLHFLNINRSGLLGNNSKHFDFLDRHTSELSNYETAWYNFLKGYYSGDIQKAFKSLNKLRKKYPKDFIINHETASIAAEAFNNPELTLEIYSELPIEIIDAQTVGIFYNFRILHQVQSFIKLKQYSNLSTFLNTIKLATETVNSNYIWAILFKALKENDSEEIDKAYALFLKVYDYDKFSFFILANPFLYSTISSSIRNRLEKDYLSNYHKLDSTDINKILWKPWAALIEGKSQNMSLDEIRKLPKIIAINSLRVEALIALNNDNKGKAASFINELMEYTSTDYSLPSAWGAGSAHYHLGDIFTKMGKPDTAIKHLKEARNIGLPVWLTYYKYDNRMVSLVGIPEFDALTDPIWPEIKD